jgi:hypothetical protein
MTNVMLKNEKIKSWQFFLSNNMTMYIKIDLFFIFPPSYDQFIIHFQLLILMAMPLCIAHLVRILSSTNWVCTLRKIKFSSRLFIRTFLPILWIHIMLWFTCFLVIMNEQVPNEFQKPYPLIKMKKPY